MFMLKLHKQKGAVSVILSILILSILLTISLALAGLVTQQIKLSSQTGDSAGAYAAADSGVEFALYYINRNSATTTAAFLSAVSADSGFLYDQRNYCSNVNPYWFPAGADASFCLDLTASPDGHIASVRTDGRYKGVRRAVEIIPFTAPEYIYASLGIGFAIDPRCRKASGVSADCDKNQNKADCPSPSFPAELTDPVNCYDWTGSASSIKYEKRIKP